MKSKNDGKKSDGGYMDRRECIISEDKDLECMLIPYWSNQIEGGG